MFIYNKIHTWLCYVTVETLAMWQCIKLAEWSQDHSQVLSAQVHAACDIYNYLIAI